MASGLLMLLISLCPARFNKPARGFLSDDSEDATMGPGYLTESSREGRSVSGVMLIGCREASIRQRRAPLVVVEDKQPNGR
jgi:hypothetical protein